MEDNTKIYELTLTPNYVSDWTFNDAMRELIQNGTDQEIMQPNNKFSMDYNEEKKELILHNETSKLHINTLLLGRSSKSNNEETVGKFGEGYKIAALVLNRLGKSFTIYNNEKNEVWTSRFKNSEKWLEKILAFYVTKSTTTNRGLDIVIGNVSNNEYEDLYEVWLGLGDKDSYEKVTTSYGEIITDEYYQGHIFVNGLAVYFDREMNYGYNFKPQYIFLERDRKTCSSWDVETMTSKMITEAVLNGDIEMEEVEELIGGQSRDVGHYTFTTYCSDTQEVIRKLIESFDKQHPEPFAIPVNSQSKIDLVKSYGGKPIVVPYRIADLLKDETERRITKLIASIPAETMTIKERLQRWINAYRSRLTEESIKQFEDILNRME